ncbi:MAG: GNAT family N-acetyltransferase [Oscillospiraceae bacterium]|nr:GNAT family N-acetyltransferase [Oscillospiraceae bacterium]
MLIREEKARELFANGYNCAQSVLGVFCEEAGLDLPTAFKLSNGFGGGIRCGEICGAVTGGIMAIGLKCGFYKEKDFEQKGYCNLKTYEFIERFKEENGSVICRDLLGVDIRSPEDHMKLASQEAFKAICPKMVTSAVRLLEGMEFREEQEVQNEIAYYNALPCVFDGFINIPELSDGAIHLVCMAKHPADLEKKWVPWYDFIICKGSEKIGTINLRIGYTDGLYYGGQIGYNVEEAHRGNGYAVRACRLLLPVARAHSMTKLLITNNHTNTASMRVCEKLGAKLVRTTRTPEWHELYKEGHRFSNIYEWSVE